MTRTTRRATKQSTHVGITAALLAACAGALPAQAPSPTTRASAAAAVNAVADEYLAYLDSVTTAQTAGAWPDITEEARRRYETREDGWLARLGAVDATRLDGSAAWLTHAVLRETLEANRGVRVCRTNLWSVDQLSGWHIGVAAAPTTMPLGTADARARALRRFAALPPYVDRRIADLRAGLAAGYAAPAPNVRRVIEQLDEMLPADPATSPLMAAARRDSTAGFPAEWAATVREHAYPALRRYRDFLAAEYLPRARATLGVGALPDGAACYRALVRAQTSLDLAPEDMPRIAAEERARVEARLAPLIAELAPGVPPERARAEVRYAPDQRFTSRSEIIDSARRHLDRARAALPAVLLRVPTVPLEVLPTPVFRERSDAPARYQPPRDSTSPGVFYANTYEPGNKPRAEAAFMAFHEGLPGHHLQRVYPQRTDSVHAVVRRAGSGGFTEGWAFYAEELANELGLYGTPRERAGYLLHQIDGWVGVQVDPAIHVGGWTREQAIDTIAAATGKPRATAASYADRHAATPAQLVTYMLGYREIVRLRAEAQQALGARFDLRRFHDVVLRDGSVPLAALRAKVERWIAEERGAAGGR